MVRLSRHSNKGKMSVRCVSGTPSQFQVKSKQRELSDPGNMIGRDGGVDFWVKLISILTTVKSYTLKRTSSNKTDGRRTFC